MLQFDSNWRFESPGQAESTVVEGFRKLIDHICGQGSQKAILEHFKAYFASVTGTLHYPSSDVSWASTDLDSVMSEAAANAPLFIEAFYDACDELQSRHHDMAIPEIRLVNRILNDACAGFQIDPPNLVATRVHISVSVPDETPSLDAQAETAIEDALQASERALSEGNGRQAVQELLWLLETISTAFRSSEILDGGINGRYFNKIIGELRQREHGHQKQILQWMMSLHGYLSSPTGGGVRHGVDLKKGLDLGINEARLYCNLIRSYVTFLISEHERLNQRIT